MAWELCTKEDVLDLHPYPADQLKNSWSENAEFLIRRHMDTPYLGTTEVLTNETHSGDGTTMLVVRKPPIVSVEALRISSIASSTADYVVFQNYVQLIAEKFPEGNLNVQIDYTSGSSTVPVDVRIAAVAMIAAQINYFKRYGADASIMWGQPDVTTSEETPNRNVGLTSHLKRIMKDILRREKVRAS